MYIRSIIVGILIIGILIGGYFMYNITQTIFKPITAFNNEVAYINLPSDAKFNDVIVELEPLVNDIESFKTLAKKVGYIDRVKGGKYVIQKGMNSNDIIKVLIANSTWVDVIVPENTTTEELAQNISNQIEATEDELYEILKDSVIVTPGTYKMPWNTSAKEFIEKVQSSSKQ